MFPLADTLRLPVFPSLRFRRNRTTFLHVSVKFPAKETRVSASVNAWNPFGNTRKRSGNRCVSCFRQRNRKYVHCGNMTLRAGNRWFQVISIVIKTLFGVLVNCCSPFLSEERGGCTEAASLDGFSLFYSKTPFFQHFNDPNTTAIFSSILSLFSLVLQLAIKF